MSRFSFLTTAWADESIRRRLFVLWLCIGLLWMLIGMQLLPSSKLYHQGLILFAWLPGLVAFVMFRDVRNAWDPLLLLLLLSVTAWAGASMGWGGEERRVKVLFYVMLAANAWVALASLNAKLFWRVLALGALVGGGLAWAALFGLYILDARPWQFRAVATGHMDHTILASHVMGALGILGLLLRNELPHALRRWAWLLASLGYLAFLLMSRSKGPMLALACAMVFAVICRPSRRALFCLFIAMAVSVLLTTLLPEVMLRGGYSYRPELLSTGYSQLLLGPWIGIGVGSEYLLSIEGLRVSFEHAHNLYLHLAIQLGIIGLLLWLALQLCVLYKALQWRHTDRGLALCTLCAFSGVALFTDGVGPWVKPREEWFTVWLPVFLCLAMTAGLKSDKWPGSDRSGLPAEDSV
ncbi:O-antigen ligase family protein [Stutzerimonas sp. VN223-3]|uniref:O-antigen ligase family protein n=1 Tax=Stutzerimonas sp. VN223-3 TaxID=3384601 RepID=UPI0038B54A19